MKTILLHRIKYLKYFVFLLFLLQNFVGKSQTPVKSAYAVFSDSLRALGQLDGAFYFKIDTTVNASAFLLQVGKFSGDTSIFKQQIAFDPQSVPTGMTYSRNGENVRIGITGNKTAWTYFCSLKMRNSQNIWSAPIKFLTN